MGFGDETKFSMLTNDKLDCKDCIYNSQLNIETLYCDYYDQKPNKVLDG